MRVIRKLRNQLKEVKTQVDNFVGVSDDENYKEVRSKLDQISSALLLFDPEDKTVKEQHDELVQTCGQYKVFIIIQYLLILKTIFANVTVKY